MGPAGPHHLAPVQHVETGAQHANATQLSVRQVGRQPDGFQPLGERRLRMFGQTVEAPHRPVFATMSGTALQINAPQSQHAMQPSDRLSTRGQELLDGLPALPPQALPNLVQRQSLAARVGRLPIASGIGPSPTAPLLAFAARPWPSILQGLDNDRQI